MEEVICNTRISGIEIIETFLIPKPSTDYIGKQFKFDLTGNAHIIEDKKILVSVIKANIRESDKELVLGSIRIGVAFEIENFEACVKKKSEPNTFEVNPVLELKLRDITIHTLRGFMFSYFRGTYLHQAVLPLLTF